VTKHPSSVRLLAIACCSVAFAVVFACGTKTRLIAPVGSTFPSSTPSVMRSGLGTFSYLVLQHSAPVLASFFQVSGTGSDVPESFQSSCNFDPGFWGTLQPGQIVAVVGFLNEFPSNTCNAAFAGPQPATVFWTSHAPNGAANYDVRPVFHSGTVQSLVVTALTSSSHELSCADLTHTATVADGDVVLAYLAPPTNTVALYDNTSPLGISCQISGLATGDTYLLLTVRYTKL
jgi:hypothetical protein